MIYNRLPIDYKIWTGGHSVAKCKHIYRCLLYIYLYIYLFITECCTE